MSSSHTYIKITAKSGKCPKKKRKVTCIEKSIGKNASEKLSEHNKRTKLPQLSELNLFKYPKIEHNLTTVNTKP